VVFALCGVALGVVAGGVLACFFQFWPVRMFCAVIRSVHELFWAFLFLPALGLSPLCGVAAIAVPYAGIFAKVYAEILEEADKAPLAGFPPNCGFIWRFLYGIWPLIYPSLRSYTAYRFECGLRSSAVLGFIGLPTLGYHLETFFREGDYSQAAAMLMAFYLLIGSLKYWLKPKLVLPLVAGAFALLPKDHAFNLQGLVRVFSYDIFPWPMRRAGFADGTNTLALPLEELQQWFLMLFKQQILPGSWNTLILTQVVLIGAGVAAMVITWFSTRHLHSALVTKPVTLANVVLRTTPEYILAYVFLQLLGPSMLPAILAIALHNGAILGHLSCRQADLLVMPIDAPRRRSDRFIFLLLPRINGQFLAFLFYRWEVMLRESAILGILGVTTLGFYIDSAMAEDRMDRAFLLIAVTALLNLVVDAISRQVRRRLDVKNALVVSQNAVTVAA